MRSHCLSMVCIVFLWLGAPVIFPEPPNLAEPSILRFGEPEKLYQSGFKDFTRTSDPMAIVNVRAHARAYACTRACECKGTKKVRVGSEVRVSFLQLYENNEDEISKTTRTS